MGEYSWYPEQITPVAFSLAPEEGGLTMSQVARGDLWQMLVTGSRSAVFADACRSALGVFPLDNRAVAGVQLDGSGIAVIWAGAGQFFIQGLSQQVTAARMLEGFVYLLDQGDGRALYRLEGPDGPVREALEKLLPLDLRPRAFGAGDALATELDHMPVNVWCAPVQDEGRLVVFVAAFRSYEASLHEVLVGAGFVPAKAETPD